MNLNRHIINPLLILLMCLLSVGCRYSYVDKPQKLLTEKEMADAIAEFAYIAALDDQGKFQEDSVLSKIGKGAFIERIYKKYDINKTILEQNNLYYSQYSKKYIRIYEKALEQTNKLVDNEDKRIRTEEEAIEAARQKLLEGLPEGTPVDYSHAGSNPDPYLNRNVVDNTPKEISKDQIVSDGNIKKMDRPSLKKDIDTTLKNLGPFYPDPNATKTKKVYGPIEKPKEQSN